MSLSDLKKKQNKNQVRKLSIEEFIADADLYAKGKSITGQPLIKPSAELKKKVTQSHFKHATFSLSVDCIEQLALLAQQTGINKSKLIRILVNKAEKDDFLSELDMN